MQMGSLYKQVRQNTSMATKSPIRWFRSRSRQLRYFLFGVFAPLTWSALLGGSGLMVGATNVHSLGATLVAVALFVHLPAVMVLGKLGLFPIGPGGEDSGGIEIMMLAIVTLPSCLFYGFTGWFLAKAMDMNNEV
jgi:hypothetical protein